MKISDLIETIKSQYRQPPGKRRPLFVQGCPGIGKSDAFVQAATDLGIGYMPLQATIEDPITLSGLPARGVNRTYLDDALPGALADYAVFLPFADKLPMNGEGLLILEEINSCPPAVMCALYDLFLHQKLGSYKLPPGWMVGATGNRDQDRAATQRIPMPLIGRWTRVEIELDLNDWTRWALRNGVRPDIVAFYQFRPDLLNTFDPQKAEPYSCPRTAAFASDIADSAPAGLEYELLCGTVGQGVATEMAAFLRVYREMVSVEDIFADPAHAQVPREPAACYAIAAAVAHAVTAANMPRALAYLARMPKEYEVLGVTLAVRRDSALQGCGAFISWAARNTQVIL